MCAHRQDEPTCPRRKRGTKKGTGIFLRNLDGQDHDDALKDLDSVAGMVNAAGGFEEGYACDTYGQVTICSYAIGDTDLDRDVDGVDFSVFSACFNQAGNPPRASGCDLFYMDYDLDGDVDGIDYGDFANAYQGAGVPPADITAGSVGNPYFFTGRPMHSLNAGNLQLQDNRNRTYTPPDGRWLQRDPYGVTDVNARSVIDESSRRPQISRQFIPDTQIGGGANLYQYVASNPGQLTDSSGPAKNCGPHKNTKKWVNWTHTKVLCTQQVTLPMPSPYLEIFFELFPASGLFRERA